MDPCGTPIVKDNISVIYIAPKLAPSWDHLGVTVGSQNVSLVDTYMTHLFSGCRFL